MVCLVVPLVVQLETSMIQLVYFLWEIMLSIEFREPFQQLWAIQSRSSIGNSRGLACSRLQGPWIPTND